MDANNTFCKTTKGQTEIETRSHGLSMQHRRVLILVNGSNDVADLGRLSLCVNAVDIVQALVADGFIEPGSQTSPSRAPEAQDYTPAESPAEESAAAAIANPESASEASEFMCNTLLTFANRVRVGKLIEQIRAADSLDGLKELVKPWYHAISETPGGMYQADDLRNEARKLLEQQEAG